MLESYQCSNAIYTLKAYRQTIVEKRDGLSGLILKLDGKMKPLVLSANTIPNSYFATYETRGEAALNKARDVKNEIDNIILAEIDSRLSTLESLKTTALQKEYEEPTETHYY